MKVEHRFSGKTPTLVDSVEVVTITHQGKDYRITGMYSGGLKISIEEPIDDIAVVLPLASNVVVVRATRLDTKQ